MKYKPSFRKFLAPVAVLTATAAFGIFGYSAQAATLVWNAGLGTWDNGTTANWNLLTSPVVWSDGNLAEFAAAGNSNVQTVSVAANVSPTGLQLNSGSGVFRFTTANSSVITISGGEAGTFSGGWKRNLGSFANFATAGLVNFAVAPTAAASDSVSEGATLNTDGILIGATLGGTDFVKSGAGTLQAATYVNTLTAGKNVNVTGTLSGSLNFAINSLRFNTGALTVTNTNTTGTLTVASGMILATANTTGNSLITGGTLAVPTGELIVDNEHASNFLVIGSNINGSFGLTKTGQGGVKLEGAAVGLNWAGPTNVLAGTLYIGSNAGGAYTSSSSQSLYIATGATVSFRLATGSQNINNLISGGGTFNGNGTNPLVLTNAANSYTGPTVLTGTTGALSVSTLANIGSNSNIGRGDATSTATNAASLVFWNGITTASLLYTGAAVNTDRLFTVNSNAPAILDASGTGALNFTNANAIAFSGTASAHTFTFQGSNAGANTFTPIIGNHGTGSSITSLNKNGAGTWALAGANTYSGATTINGGTLSINTIQNAGSTTANALGRPAVGTNSIIALGTTGTLRYTGPTAGSSDRVIRLATAAGGTFTLDASGAATFALSGGITTAGTGATTSTLALTGTGSGSQSGSIVNGASGNVTAISKSGSGTWTLSGNNSYTGATGIQGGTLALGSNNALPDASAVSIGAGTLAASTFTDTLGTLDPTAAATINLGSGGALAFANSSAVDWTGGTLNITGTFTPTSIRFGTTSGGLTAGQLALISVNGSGTGTYQLDSSGYLISGSLYDTWANGTFVPPLTAKLSNNDQDGDSLTNLQEYAFGTQPSVSTGEIAYSGETLTTPGAPKIVAAAGTYSMVFGRRANYVAAGLTYTVQFSTALEGWVDNDDATNPPVQVATDSTINAMRVQYPDRIETPSGPRKPTFSRVKVVLAP